MQRRNIAVRARIRLPQPCDVTDCPGNKRKLNNGDKFYCGFCIAGPGCRRLPEVEAGEGTFLVL